MLLTLQVKCVYYVFLSFTIEKLLEKKFKDNYDSQYAGTLI